MIICLPLPRVEVKLEKKNEKMETKNKLKMKNITISECLIILQCFVLIIDGLYGSSSITAAAKHANHGRKDLEDDAHLRLLSYLDNENEISLENLEHLSPAKLIGRNNSNEDEAYSINNNDMDSIDKLLMMDDPVKPTDKSAAVIESVVAPHNVTIQTEVTPAKIDEETKAEGDIKKLFDMLTDEWWKMAICILVIIILVCLFCCLTKCWYLVWDCCTDSYWGCCPRKECCKRFLLLRWCGYEREGDENDKLTNEGGKYEYQICRNEDYTETRDSSMVFNGSSHYKNANANGIDETKSGSDTYVDFTLRNVEDVIGESSVTVEDPIATRWKDTSLTVLSTLGNKSQSKRSIVSRNGSQKLSGIEMNNPTTPLRTSNSDVSSKKKGFTNRPNVVTSTPRRKPTRNSQFPYSDDGMFEVYAGDAEALPHVHKGHYFNVMNVFGLGGGKCEYSLANSTADNSFYTPIIKGQSRDRKASNQSNYATEQKDTSSSRGCSPTTDNKSVQNTNSGNNSDFLLSNSFSNVSYQRYGLHIEEGRTGKYHPLPEAQSQLFPPDKLIMLQHNLTPTTHAEKKALIASRRRSRSMDTFSKLHHHQNNQSSLTNAPDVVRLNNSQHMSSRQPRSQQGFQSLRRGENNSVTRSHTDVLVHHRESYEVPKPNNVPRQRNGSRSSSNRNSKNNLITNGDTNYRSSGSGTPSPPIPPERTSSHISSNMPLLNGHAKDDDVQRITVEDNRSKFAIYSLPNKPRKVSKEKKTSNEVTPMALSSVMPLLISNGNHERENGSEENSDNSKEEYNPSRISNGLPPQYPNRSSKTQPHKLKASNNYVPDYQNYNGSQDSNSSQNIVNGSGAANGHSGSSSVPRRHKRRSKKPGNDNSYCVDSDIEHHILYGKETTL